MSDHCELLDTRSMTPVDYQRAVGELDYLMSMRLHPLIFAFNTNTPFVAFNYADKVVQFVGQVGEEEKLVDMYKDGWGSRAVELITRKNIVKPMHNNGSKIEFQYLLDESYQRFERWLAA